MENRNKILEFPNKELLHEQAAGWVARMEEGQLSRAQISELKQWVAQSEQHKQILLDTAKVWDRMDVISGLSELLSLEDIPPTNKSAFFNPALQAIAASLVCFAVLAYFYLGDKEAYQAVPEELATVETDNGPATYQTQIGSNDVIHLKDGSVVKLNTASQIKVELNETERRVTLVDGEAYFEVAKNEKVPFIVRVGNTTIQAVGTAFSVLKQSESIEVTVTEGLVRVKRKHMDTSLNIQDKLEPVLLRAGQVAQLNESGNKEIREIKAEEIARKLLWQQRMLAFDGDTLEQVVDEFSRYTSFKISIADAETAAIRVGGYFRSDDIAGLLTSLEDNFSISVAQTAADSFELQKK